MLNYSKLDVGQKAGMGEDVFKACYRERKGFNDKIWHRRVTTMGYVNWKA